MREEKINKINLFIKLYGNNKSFMKENEKATKEMIAYYNSHNEDEFRKEYPLCTYTIDEMKYSLKLFRKALRNIIKNTSKEILEYDWLNDTDNY